MSLLKFPIYGAVTGGTWAKARSSQKPLQTRDSCTPHSSDNLLGSEVRDAQV